MPKSNLRYKQINRKGLDTFQSRSPPSDLLLCTPPRKVSFEDKRNDSDVSISSDDTLSQNKNKIIKAGEENKATVTEQERKSIGRKRSLLVRPITSLSLVDLAIEQCEGSSGETTEERSPKRIRSFDISPRSVATQASSMSDSSSRDLSCSMQPASPEGALTSIRISPWGHFVDTTQDEDNNIDLPPTPYQIHNFAVNCKNSLLSRSWRRHSPYGEYKSYINRIEEPTLNFAGLQSGHFNESNRRFRLSPRNNHSTQDRLTDGDDLIGVFSELQVRHDVM
jgi:hypothetical protein